MQADAHVSPPPTRKRKQSKSNGSRDRKTKTKHKSSRSRHMQSNGWTIAIFTLVIQWHDYAQVMSRQHDVAATRAKQLYWGLSIPNVILTTLSGTGGFVAFGTSSNTTASTVLRTLSASFALASAVLIGIQSLISAGEKAIGHRTKAVEYELMARNIEIMVSKGERERLEGSAYVEQLIDVYKGLAEKSPHIGKAKTLAPHNDFNLSDFLQTTPDDESSSTSTLQQQQQQSTTITMPADVSSNKQHASPALASPRRASEAAADSLKQLHGKLSRQASRRQGHYARYQVIKHDNPTKQTEAIKALKQRFAEDIKREPDTDDSDAKMHYAMHRLQQLGKKTV